jgi:hypothetical protein
MAFCREFEILSAMEQACMIEIEPESHWTRIKPRSVVVVERVADGTVLFRNSKGKRYGLKVEEFTARFEPVLEERP